MPQPSDRIWQSFRIEDIFRMEAKGNVPTGGYVRKECLYEGHTPRITVTSKNNGINDFWNDITHSSYKTHENFISVSFLGDVFYHPKKASIDMKVHCLQLNDRELTEPLAIFLCRALRNNTEHSSYGNQLSSNDLPKKSIMLPVNCSGEPDYEFMEQFIEDIRYKKKQDYLDYCNQQLSKLTYKTIPELSEKKWKSIPINELFKISSGKRLESYNMASGKRPFIGATDSGNGITNYVSNTNSSLDKNVLGVNYNGNGMVISFYHPYECILSDDVKRFHLIHYDDNQFVLLFFKTLILKQKNKYNYGYKFNEQRMLRQYIQVPVDNNDEPDYAYMEQYIKNITIEKYKTYLSYID